MDEQQQQEIEAHLQEWASSYTRCNKIMLGVIRFADANEEEREGMEAYNKWDKECCWLDAQGIRDADIVYDEATESATLTPDKQAQLGYT